MKIRPKLLDCLRAYTSKDFIADGTAGITVGLVALPLAMAFGIASGVTPQAGLYTAIVGGAIVALFGGSKVQIAGPTGAFVVIVAGIVAKHGVSGLAMVTMMAGVMLLALGISGLGNAVKFIPRPIIIGFTNGIALLIASTQIKDFLGLKYVGNPGDFFTRIKTIALHIGTIDWSTACISLACVAIIVALPKVLPRIPAAIVALIAGTLGASLLHLPVETLGSRFGGIGGGLPPIEVPAFRPDLILPLLPSAFTVAILAAVESLLSAVVADSLIGDRHDSNTELVAQGAANTIVPLIGGIPVTGAIARTGTNIRSGARTPVAGLTHALTLLVIVLVFAPLAKAVPLATLAAVLMVVSYNIGEWREIKTILRLDKTDKAVWAVTFGLTVMADLTVAVGVGMALAALLYIYRISQTTSVSIVTPEEIEDARVHVLQDKSVPEYVSIVRIHGPFLFGTTDKLAEATRDINALGDIVVLRLRNTTALDATGLHAIESLATRLRASGRTLLVCGARYQPSRLLQRAEFQRSIGMPNILPNVEAALARAEQLREEHGSSIHCAVTSAFNR